MLNNTQQHFFSFTILPPLCHGELSRTIHTDGATRSTMLRVTEEAFFLSSIIVAGAVKFLIQSIATAAAAG